MRKQSGGLQLTTTKRTRLAIGTVLISFGNCPCTTVYTPLFIQAVCTVCPCENAVHAHFNYNLYLLPFLSRTSKTIVFRKCKINITFNQIELFNA